MTHSFSILQSDMKLKLQGWLRGKFNKQQHLTNSTHWIFLLGVYSRKKNACDKTTINLLNIQDEEKI